MKYFSKFIDLLNEFVTNNSDLIENWNNFLGVLASLFAIFGIFLAIVEYFKNYHPNVKAETKVGNVFIVKERVAFFAIVVKVKNNSTFKINTEDVFIEIKPKRDISLKALDTVTERIERKVPTKKHDEQPMVILNSPDIVEHVHAIEERSSKMFYLTLNEKIIKRVIAEDNLSSRNLRKRIYVKIETVNRSYRLYTPYTIKNLLEAEKTYQEEKKKKKNSFDFVI